MNVLRKGRRSDEIWRAGRDGEKTASETETKTERERRRERRRDGGVSSEREFLEF